MSKYFRLLHGGHREKVNGVEVDFLAKKDGVRQQVKTDDGVRVYPDVIQSDRDLAAVFKGGRFEPATEADFQETLAIIAADGMPQVSAEESSTNELEKELEGGDDRGVDVSSQFDTNGVSGLKVFLKSKKYHVYLNDELQEGGSGLKKDQVASFIELNF